MHLEGARDIMPGAAVSAACGLPSPRTDPETDVGASPHAKTSGTKRPAAVVTPSPDPKRPKGSHRPPQQETDEPAVDSPPLSALSDEKPTPQARRRAARDKQKALNELKTTGCGLLDGESAVTVPPPATPAPSTTSTTVAATGALEEPEMATPEKSNPQSRPWSIVRMLRGIGHAMLVVLCGLFSKAQFPLVFSITPTSSPWRAPSARSPRLCPLLGSPSSSRRRLRQLRPVAGGRAAVAVAVGETKRKPAAACVTAPLPTAKCGTTTSHAGNKLRGIEYNLDPSEDSPIPSYTTLPTQLAPALSVSCCPSFASPPFVLVVLATAAWRRQCAQCAPSCSPQSPYAHAIGPSY